MRLVISDATVSIMTSLQRTWYKYGIWKCQATGFLYKTHDSRIMISSYSKWTFPIFDYAVNQLSLALLSDHNMYETNETPCYIYADMCIQQPCRCYVINSYQLNKSDLACFAVAPISRKSGNFLCNIFSIPVQNIYNATYVYRTTIHKDSPMI